MERGGKGVLEAGHSLGVSADVWCGLVLDWVWLSGVLLGRAVLVVFVQCDCCCAAYLIVQCGVMWCGVA